MITRSAALVATCCITVAAGIAGGQALPDQRLFKIDAQGLVRRSDIVLKRPNTMTGEAMALGNGTLGAAVWAEDGFTAQLNRADTLPLRLSPGQLVVPGLAKLASASDFSARVDMYDGEFQEQGGGLTATAYIQKSTDVFELDVSGADPAVLQTAILKLWEPRHPVVQTADGWAVISETWQDTVEAGASGQTFGSLAAVKAEARDVRVEQTSPLSATLSFHPRADGTFRILVAAPGWRGGDGEKAAAPILEAAAKLGPDDHRKAWHAFWERAFLMKLSSPDGMAEYFENLRTIDLYAAAGESLDRFPGSQAGIGDLYSSIRDAHQWGPSAYWHFNLRMQVAANLGAGLPELNQSYFRLYRENLPAMLKWTHDHMGGREGICIPETMRFNGQGYENETWLHVPAPINCGEDYPPYYNARTLSTGAEVSLWIWEQYRFTNDMDFLRTNYPVMREAARFLFAYATRGKDGKLHTYPANANENVWDVHDPITNVAAMRALFPAVAEAATLLKVDPELVATLRSATTQLPDFPIVRVSDRSALVSSAAAFDDTIFAESYDPAAPIHNVENTALEPVWPYSLIADDGPMHGIAVRTFMARRNQNEADWSWDPIEAARLGMAGQVKSSLLALTTRYQLYPNGLAKFFGEEFYVEQIGVLTGALQEALAQDYDGLLRVAPAWPDDWSADATIALHYGGRARVLIRKGQLQGIAIQAGARSMLRLRNPWPNQNVEVIGLSQPDRPLQVSSASIVEIPVQSQETYIVQRSLDHGAGHSTLALFESTSGVPATAPKVLGAEIGLTAK
ncbi:MAG: glycoside hydrolase [Terriglobales bacterium]